MRTAIALVLAACGSSPTHPFEPPVQVTMAVKIEPAHFARLGDVIGQALAAEGSDGAAELHTVQLRTTTLVRDEPRLDADKTGIVRGGTRAAVERVAPGDDGCASRWLELVPRGWVCESAVEPSSEAPTPADALTLHDADRVGLKLAVPGVYGYVRGKDVQAFTRTDDAAAGENGRTLAGTNSVRAAGAVTIEGRRYWRTTTGELIDASAIVALSPSSFHGVALEPGASLPVWVRGHRDPYAAVVSHAADGTRVRTLAPRTIVTIAETSADGTQVRIGDDEWLARADVRIAASTEPPQGTGADEKWFDVDLDEQVLVAYEGTRPVYATLVSTGKYGHATPTGILRIQAKHQAAAMSSAKVGEAYAVADVPWTMYYDGDFALHTSYWHDGFGGVRSHGCVNLAPRDALLLYLWSSPDVPPGWITVYGNARHPGSLVRIRSTKLPDPAFRGYARSMREAASTVASR